MTTLIVVPARFGSTRFPGKPLAMINGVSMVRRTARIAQDAAKQIEDCSYVCLLYTSPSPRDRG